MVPPNQPTATRWPGVQPSTPAHRVDAAGDPVTGDERERHREGRVDEGRVGTIALDRRPG
ncbi:hypothetical protein ACQEVC_41995 [Plantactinospora sp. CA-294935]|uniref:hypothetical protein n=1 Tax=Plantactinospora sp. CA-294935 TaxID=3240012 RepID=UPI003D93607F